MTATRREFLAYSAAACGAWAVAGSAPGNNAPRPAAKQRRSFSFLHTFEATGRYWNALEKAGLLRAGTGVRLVHSSPWGGEGRGFNRVARVNGELHRYIAEHCCPFIIDRVAGGLPYAPYEFDRALLKTYDHLLGEKFLGGQIHEVISNTRNDWNRLAEASGAANVGKPVDVEGVRKFFAGGEGVNNQLEFGTLDDYAGRIAPRSREEWWHEFERAAHQQIDRVKGLFSYCEGSHFGWPAWGAMFKLGARYGIAEQGVWASPQGQLSIASLRGAARAAGRPWGVFYAPWGPNGCTAFTPPRDWAWNCPEKFLKLAGWPCNPESGSSSAMQRRLFFHAYLSGAWTLHEEWGSDANFTNWDTAALSSSGQVVKELLNFQDANPDAGEPYTPLAILLDAPDAQPNPTVWDPLRAALFKRGPADEALSKLSGNGAAEANCYMPCSVPEIFDIIPAEAPPAMLGGYKKIMKPDNVDEILRQARELSPIARESHLSMQINRRMSDGAWIVALYNPWGAVRGDVYNTGSILNENCAQHDTLRPNFAFKRARMLYAWPKSSNFNASEKAIDVTVGPGGVLILELAT